MYTWAAAPHRMLQVGTSLSVTVHSAGLLGVGVDGTGAGVVVAGVATVTFRAGRSRDHHCHAIVTAHPDYFRIIQRVDRRITYGTGSPGKQ